MMIYGCFFKTDFFWSMTAASIVVCSIFAVFAKRCSIRAPSFDMWMWKIHVETDDSILIPGRSPKKPQASGEKKRGKKKNSGK